MLRKCHDRLCTSPCKDDHGHDIAACHAAMTGAAGTIVKDAGYYSQDNISAPGPGRITLTGKRHAAGRAARQSPAKGPPPQDATPAEINSHRLRTPEGHALYKHRAPDVEGLHASLEDRIGLRRFRLRGLVRALPAETKVPGEPGRRTLSGAVVTVRQDCSCAADRGDHKALKPSCCRTRLDSLARELTEEASREETGVRASVCHR